MTEARQKKKSNTKANVITAIVIAAAAVVLAVSLFQLARGGAEYAEGVRIYDGIRAQAKAAAGGPEGAAETAGAPFPVDFGALKRVNDEIVAWIDIPQSGIDYPVAQADNNEYYLSHAADGTENNAGAVFLDMANAPDLSDRNTVVYGHNMKNGSMFAGLHRFEDESWTREHPYVYLYTPDGKTHAYRVFAAFETTDELQPVSFATDAEFLDYVADAQSKTGYDADVEVGAGKKIVTLSTCITGQGDSRFVVMAAEAPEQRTDK